MLSQNLNPLIFQHFKRKVHEVIGFQCILCIPPRNNLFDKTSEVQRYSRIQEHHYMQLLSKSAVVLQKHARVFLAKCTLKRLRKERDRRIRNAAALCIQCAFRVWRARKQRHWLSLVRSIRNLRNSAASAIQRAYKVCVLRLRLKVLKRASNLIRIRTKAAVLVQKYAKGWLVRSDTHFLKLKQKSKLVRWKHRAQSVLMAGSFTKPPWSIQIPLVYSKYLEQFYTTFFQVNRVDPGKYYLKFIVDGVWVCDGDLPLENDSSGNFNNVLVIEQKKIIPRALSVRSLQDNAVARQIPISQKSNESPQKIIRTYSGNLNSPRMLEYTREQKPAQKVKLVFGKFMAAHPKNKSSPLDSEGSADAFFVEEEQQLFGLADGVGEWETFGLDASLFPKELMENVKFYFSEMKPRISQETESNVNRVLEQVLYEAYTATESYGSSTVLLGYCRDSFLHTLSLGDSGFMILREREGSSQLSAVFKTTEQQHSFNCPYQLAKLPQQSDFPKLLKKGLSSLVSVLKRANKTCQDSPYDCNSETVSLRPGDIIIGASDGLFDNLYEQEIAEVCGKFLRIEDPQERCYKSAKELVEKAVERGWDDTYRSPFAKNAAKSGKRYYGGKLDDTSVIVSVAVPDCT